MRRLVGPITLVLSGVLLMSFWDGFTKNWADYEAGSPDPGLRPITLPVPPSEAVDRIAGLIPILTRWSVVSADREAGVLHLTHKTVVWRFVDDVRLRVVPDPERPGGSLVLGQSRSRIGQGDLGQNARNLRGLREAVERALGQMR